MAKLLDADINQFPLSGSTIHKQPDRPDLIAVGQSELEKLPKGQRKAVDTLGEDETPLVGFLNTEDGSLVLTDGGSPIAAQVDKKGNIMKHVAWL